MSTPIATRLITLRSHHQQSQYAFAKRIGISRGYLAAMEQGKPPSFNAVMKLLGSVSVDANWLLMGHAATDYVWSSSSEASMSLAKSAWAAPLFATLRRLLDERINQRGETVEEIAERAVLTPLEVQQVIERGRIQLDRAAKLCGALDAEICARSAGHGALELSEQAAEAWGVAPGEIRDRAFNRRVIRTSGMEPKPDPIEDALPAQPPPTDHRLVRVLAWIRDWWSVSRPDVRTWLYEDLRRQYPEFRGWLKERASENHAEEGEVLR